MPELLTITQLSERLQVSERKIYELTRRKNRERQRVPLPCIRIGRCVRFKAEEIDKWLHQLQQETQ